MNETVSNGKFEYRATGGYDKTQVDSFIIEVKKYIAAQKSEKALLTQKMHILAAKIKEYQNYESQHGEYTQTLAELESQKTFLKENINSLSKQITELESKRSETAKAAEEEEFSLGLTKEQTVAANKELEEILNKIDLFKKQAESKKEELETLVSAEDKLMNSAHTERESRKSVRVDVITGISDLKASFTEMCDSLIRKYSSEEVEDVSEEQLRAARDAAKSVLEEMTGKDEVEDNTTKLMPEVEKVLETAEEEKTVDIVINAPVMDTPEPEEDPEEPQEELSEKAETPVSDDTTSNIDWDLFSEISDEDNENETEITVNKAKPQTADPEPINVLMEEENRNLSYDDALNLVLMKNGTNNQSSVFATEGTKKTTVPTSDENKQGTEKKVSDSAREEQKKPEKEKKKNKFFSTLRDSLSAILEDDEDDEESEADQGTKRYR